MRVYKRCIALLCCVLLLFTSVGCDKEVQVPELLQPIESLDALYTVAKSDMESVDVVSGFVAPESVHMSFDYSTTVENIQVREGDHVTTGDLLFVQNPEAERLARELALQIEIKEATYELDLERFEEQIAQMKKSMSSMRKSGNYYGANLMQLQIDEQQLYFDREHAAEKEAIAADKEELAILQEQVATTQVLAPCDGTVIYLAISEEENYISEGRTFLSIAKDGTKQLACSYFDSETYASFDSVQAQIGGVYYDVNYIAYTEEEVANMESDGGPAYSYFTVEGLPDTVKCGDFAAFYVTSRLDEPVIAVPKESVTKDGSSYYVTVMQGDARIQKEVTIGQSGLNMTEITSGLSEGEVVYVAKDLARYGVTYETVTLEEMDLSASVKVTGANRVSMAGEPFYNPVPGEITEIFISNFSQVAVEEGQQLYTIQPSIDKADWEQTKIDLANYEEEYAEEVERLAEEIEEYEEYIDELDNKLEKELAKIELERKQESYDEYIEEGKERIADLTERVANYELWSQGPVTVCAEKKGVISSFSAYVVGDKLSENQYMCDLYDPEAFCIVIEEEEDEESGLRYGMKVVFSSKLAGESYEFSGKVVSAPNVLPGDANEDNRIVILLDENRYMEGNNAGTIIYQEYNLQGVMVLDNTVVYHETTAEEEESESSNIKPIVSTQTYIPAGKPYVWVYDSNGCAVKRYITIARYSDNYWICDGIDADDIIIIH